MKIFSILNHKGGVGKTTTTLHLGSALAKKQKVLLIDFDRQTNLTDGYKVDDSILFTINDFHYPYKEIDIFKVKDENLFILKGSQDLVWKGKSLKWEIEKLNEIIINRNQKPFDIVIIDCPPSVPEPLNISNRRLTLGEIALTSSDYLISVLECDEYSINGLDKLITTYLNIKNKYNSKLKFGGMFFNMVESNTNRFKRNYAAALNNPKIEKYFFKNYIRKDESLFYAKELGLSVFAYNPKTRSALDFEKLTEEIIERINL